MSKACFVVQTRFYLLCNICKTTWYHWCGIRSCCNYIY